MLDNAENCDIKVDNKGIMTIRVDTKAKGRPSSSGKSTVIATTKGNKLIEELGLYVGVNIYKK